MDKPVLLCPLRFEQKMLLTLGLEDRFTVACCGPGAGAVTAWVQAAAGRCRGREQRIILAGLAAALDSTPPCGSAWLVTEVRSADGLDHWIPSLTGPAAPGDPDCPPPCVAVTTAEVVADPEVRRGLRAQSGADIVDMESVPFAVAAESCGMPWGIIRGISDTATAPLPPVVAGWIDQAGNPRWGKALASVAVRPWLSATLLTLRHRGRTAMRQVAEIAARLARP